MELCVWPHTPFRQTSSCHREMWTFFPVTTFHVFASASNLLSSLLFFLSSWLVSSGHWKKCDAWPMAFPMHAVLLPLLLPSSSRVCVISCSVAQDSRLPMAVRVPTRIHPRPRRVHDFLDPIIFSRGFAPRGLEDQLLASVVGAEQPELEKTKNDLVQVSHPPSSSTNDVHMPPSHLRR